MRSRRVTDNKINHAVMNEDDELIVEVSGGTVDISGGDINVNIPPSTDFAARGLDVGITATLIDTSILPNTFYILIQADIDNTLPVYIGKATVVTSGTLRGTQLISGMSVTYPVASGVYAIADDANQKVIYTLFNGAV